MSYYLVPLVVGGPFGSRVAKYFFSDFGMQPRTVPFDDNAIVWIDDAAPLTPAQKSFLQAQPDAVAVPPIDNTIGAGALGQVQGGLESLRIPADWVQVGMSYRMVLRVVVGMAQFLQRTAGLGNPVKLPTGAALDLTMAELSAANRQTLQDAAATMPGGPLDVSAIGPTTTVRQVLYILGQQFADGRAISFGDL
jgi:hypothetical protein